MTIKAKYEAAKKHLKSNKAIYISGTVGVLIGGITVYLLKNNDCDGKISMPRFWSPGDNNVMKVFINPLGDPGNVVQCVETSTVYASQGQAARELGVDPSVISKHLSGLLDDVKGNHLIVLGKAGQPIAE